MKNVQYNCLCSDSRTPCAQVLDVDGSQFDEGLGHVDIYAELGEVATMHDGTGRMIDKYKVRVIWLLLF